MMTTGRAIELRANRVPFVSATVVRAEPPTSAKAGDTAVVLADGQIEGFVGGACAESSVRVEALACLASDAPMLLRVVPEVAGQSVDPVGQRTVANPCLSGGTLEIFLEPVLPPALVYTVGGSPIALALSRAGGLFGFDLRLFDELPTPLPHDLSAVVVASHGRNEETALTVAIDASVPYVGLVASHKRGAAVVAGLGNSATQSDFGRIRYPAGLDIGANNPEEVALSILAEIVADRTSKSSAMDQREQTGGDSGFDEPVAPQVTVIDPVCGMSVAAVAASLQVSHKGTQIYFCGSGCREAFTASPDRY